MGRVKLQIKRIENTTNRQVTFSKRRNGLIKKAYELSVLCDVDIALIMFSPSGRVSHFSGNNKSIEDILARYINLPEPERGRLHNQEFLKRALGQLRGEADRTHQETSPRSSNSLLEEIQQDILRCKAQMGDMENRLRIYEGDPSEITSTLCEAEYQEQILEETLRRVHMRKQVLEGKYNSSGAPLATSTVPPNSADERGIAPENPTNMLDWLPRRDPQVQILNFLDSNGLLPLRGQQQHLVEVLPPSPTLFRGPNTDFDDHVNSRSCVVDESHLQRPEFGQVIDINLSPSTELYQAGNRNFPAGQSGARALLRSVSDHTIYYLQAQSTSKVNQKC